MDRPGGWILEERFGSLPGAEAGCAWIEFDRSGRSLHIEVPDDCDPDG
ncbi:MAG: hypothetical protein OEV40_10800 [Acidimicrobiia bacterium]|nr:hypothetical protein [Acidimicrobiia bacterium]